MSRSSASLFPTLILFALACATRPDAAAPPGNEVRDSAGVSIADNHMATLATPWVVDSSPIATADGHDPSLLLNGVVSATRLSDGRLIIVNSNPVRIFLVTPRGAVVRQFGRRGGGPGEFGLPEYLTTGPGGRFTIWDRNFGPGFTFDTLGHVVGEFHTDLERFNAAIGAGMVSESRIPFPGVGIVATVGQAKRSVAKGISGWQVEWGRTAYLVVDSGYRSHSAGSYVSSLAAVSTRVDGSKAVVFPYIFPVSYAAVSGSQLYLSQGSKYLVEVRDSTGRLLRSIRKHGAPARMDDTLFARMTSGRVNTPGGVSDADAQAGLKVLPDQHLFPPIMGLVVGAEGDLWVRESMTRWSVFSRDGAWLTSLDLPFFKLFEVGKEHVLGMTVDADGVQSVVALRLRRG